MKTNDVCLLVCLWQLCAISIAPYVGDNQYRAAAGSTVDHQPSMVDTSMPFSCLSDQACDHIESTVAANARLPETFWTSSSAQEEQLIAMPAAYQPLVKDLEAPCIGDLLHADGLCAMDETLEVPVPVVQPVVQVSLRLGGRGCVRLLCYRACYDSVVCCAQAVVLCLFCQPSYTSVASMPDACLKPFLLHYRLEKLRMQAPAVMTLHVTASSKQVSARSQHAVHLLLPAVRLKQQTCLKRQRLGKHWQLQWLHLLSQQRQ